MGHARAALRAVSRVPAASRICPRVRQHADAAAPRFLLPRHSRPQGEERRTGSRASAGRARQTGQPAATSSRASCSRPARTTRARTPSSPTSATSSPTRPRSPRCKPSIGTATSRSDASTLHEGRLFASPVANSDDGLGAPLTSADESWHPVLQQDLRRRRARGNPHAEGGDRLRHRLALSADGGGRSPDTALSQPSAATPASPTSSRRLQRTTSAAS